MRSSALEPGGRFIDHTVILYGINANIAGSEFVFVGYLVQERYVRNWWKREGKRLASLENTVRPSFEEPQWQSVGDVLNLTEFLLTLPDISKFPGWLLHMAIPRLHVEMLDPHKGRILGTLRYEYALHLVRSDVGLKRLGYEVMDAKIERLSILNNCGYSIEEIEANVGRLNEFSLLETAEDARKFLRYIKTETADHHLDDLHSDGIILEVLGDPNHW